MNSTEVLLASSWKELRTEVAAWDTSPGTTANEDMSGFDGYTRFWCEHAVLGVYWIAEQQAGREIAIFLTPDIELVGFKEPLAEKPDDSLKRKLAENAGWYESAATVIRKLTENQMSLF